MTKTEITIGKPIVKKVSKASDKKSESSSVADGTSEAVKQINELDKRVTKAVLRATRAVEAGVEGYSTRRDGSAHKTKNGSALDAFQNLAHGVSKAIAESSPIITDAAEAVSTDRLPKQVRRAVRNIADVSILD